MPLCEGFRYCLTIIDRFSRYPHAVPLQDQQADSVAFELWAGWISLFGPPETITTDQGANFESELFATLARFIGAQRIHTTPYHPQGNGMVERSHRTLKAALMCNSGTPWVRALYSVLMGLRGVVKEDLGMSPYQLMFGAAMRVPGDLLTSCNDPPAEPKTFVQKLVAHFKALRPIPTTHHVAKKKTFVHKDLGTCTHVFRRIDAVKPPLTPPYAGPYEVVRRVDSRRYVVNIDGEHKTLSTECLKPAYVAAQDQVERPPTRQRVTFNVPAVVQPTQPTQPTARQASRPRCTQPTPTVSREDSTSSSATSRTSQPTQASQPPRPAQSLHPMRATSMSDRRADQQRQVTPSAPRILQRHRTSPSTVEPQPTAPQISQPSCSSWPHQGVPTRGGVAVAVPSGPVTSGWNSLPFAGRMRGARKQELRQREADSEIQFG